MLTLIENGTVFSPRPLGKCSILLGGSKILAIGEIDARSLRDLDVEIVDAQGSIVTPGWIDPHQHLTGGSGEDGFSSQTPPLTHTEVALSGCSTVVGCLGVDATMKTLPDLLARVKSLRESGISAYAFTGGYSVPVTTLLGSLRDDVLFIDEIIGAGEIAVADLRATEPTARQLARIATDCYVAGTLSRKAGVLHFHVGSGKNRLAILRKVLDRYEIQPSTLYPTHLERNTRLLDEGIDLTRKGVTSISTPVTRTCSKLCGTSLNEEATPES